ncbi:MAG TPA: hypothetical protein VFY29_16730 [Terriglobia bacterium]|nr:hypothetical protein [Terriglobia bacterium]
MRRTNAVWLALAAVALGIPIGHSGAAGAGGVQSPALPRTTQVLRAIALVADASGNLLAIESGRIRKLTPEGDFPLVAGTGRQGYGGDGGPAVDAGFEHPDDIALDAKGNIYVADNLGHRIRQITPDGKIRTVAGTGAPGYSGDGGPASAAKLQSPVRVALDAAGNLFIADSGNARIRKVNTAGVISTAAGIGREGFGGDNGPATSAAIGQVSGMAVDRAGNLYFGDFDRARIRKVTAATGIISTIAGNGVETSAGDGGPALRAAVQPFNLALDSANNLFVVEVNRVRRISSDGVIRTVAGNGTGGFSGDGGAASAAQLRGPSAVAVDSKGNLFIADTLNGRIRRVTPDGIITTIAGSTPPPPPSALIPTVASRGVRGTGSISVLAGATPSTLPSATQSIATSGRPVLLETRLGMLPHPPLTTVKDCGHVPKNPAQTTVSCIEEAVRGKTPFIASFEQKGVDSQVIMGLGGTAPDSVVQMLFDSSSAGSNARVSAPRDCPDPKLTIAAGAVQVACQPK